MDSLPPTLDARKQACSRNHLTSEFDAQRLGSFDRDELQALLERKSLTPAFSADDPLSDLKQTFGMAVPRGYLHRKPAAVLFTPRECRRAR